MLNTASDKIQAKNDGEEMPPKGIIKKIFKAISPIPNTTSIIPNIFSLFLLELRICSSNLGMLPMLFANAVEVLSELQLPFSVLYLGFVHQSTRD